MVFDTHYGAPAGGVNRDLDFDTGLLGGFGVDFHVKVEEKMFFDGDFTYYKVNKAKFDPKNKARAVVFLKKPDE